MIVWRAYLKIHLFSRTINIWKYFYGRALNRCDLATSKDSSQPGTSNTWLPLEKYVTKQITFEII